MDRNATAHSSRPAAGAREYGGEGDGDTAQYPMLRPDEPRIGRMKDLGEGMPNWRIAVLDLASGVQTVRPEERGLDDQVYWRDDDTLLYGRPCENAAGDTDV